MKNHVIRRLYQNTKLLFSILALHFFILSCSDTSGGGGSNNRTSPSTSNVSSTSNSSTSTSSSTSSSTGTSTSSSTTTTQTPSSITAGTLAANNVNTSDSLQNNCVSVSFTVLASDSTPIAGATINFGISVISGGNSPSDMGTLTPASVATDTSGKASTSFCAALALGSVSITGQVGILSANSGVISVTRVSNYTFTAVADILGAALNTNVVNLNLMNSGPVPCSTLYFQLKQNSVGVSGASATFSSAPNFPTGLKLARLNDTGSTSTDLTTGHVTAVTTVTSDSNGVFTVPVCAGTALGSTSISGSYTDNINITTTVAGPTIYVNSGLTSWENMSIQYAYPDARTIIAALDGSSSTAHNFTIKLNSMTGGGPILSYPVNVATESAGSLIVNNGGIPASDGTVTFSLRAPHLDTYRPHQVYQLPSTSLSAQSLAARTCDPNALVQLDETSHGSEIWYTDIAKNWRMNVVYSVRGQDFFYDAHQNGVYTSGGCGFYDVNQNGYYDSGVDTLTTTGPCSWTEDWFIDMGSPFVSLDKSNIYQPGVDIPLGGTYVAPSDTYKSDTIIWKSFVAPIYMGTSVYAINHAAVTYNDLSDLTSSSNIASTYFTGLQTQGWLTHALPTHFSETTYSFPSSAAFLSDWRYIFAHSKCGTPLPGATALQTTFTDTYSPQYGSRSFTSHFYMQPGDQALEPIKQLLNGATGASSTTINYNVLEHASSSASYPVEFVVNADACTNPCTGALASDGVACDAHSAIIDLTVDTATISNSVSLPSVQTCSCVANATFLAGSCTCNAGLSFTNGACQ